jgi:hypothetical protein
MGRSVVIKTPLLTSDEMAKRLGVGKKRLAEIKEIVRTPSSGSAGRHTSGSFDRKAERLEKAAG